MSIGQLLGIMPLNYFFSSGGGPAFVEPAIASNLRGGVGSLPHVRRGPAHPPTAGSGRLLDGQHTSPPGRAGRRAVSSAPFGSGAAAATIAGWEMRRHMDEYGTTEEQFALNAVTQRHHATLNEDALMHEPMTVEDYLSSRFVSKPVRLFDCDYPVDSSSAVIFTTAERARDWQKKPVMVESYTLTAIRDMNFSQLPDFARTAPVTCAETLWSRTDLTPADVDCASSTTGSPSSRFSGSRPSDSAALARPDRLWPTATPASGVPFR